MCIRRVLGPMMGIITAAIAGCQISTPVPQFSNLRFDHLKPISLDVGVITVLSQYKPSFRLPNVEHLMPVPPERAASQWARDRLRAVGNTARQAIFTIRQAPVIKKQLTLDTGIMGYFKKEQAEYYEARIDVLLEVHDDGGRVIAEATAAANRSRTVSEDVTLNERNRIWHDMVEALIMDMNNTLEGTIHRYLARYLINNP